MNNDGHFRLTDPQGNIIARGPLDMLMERIPQSVPRMRAEEAIQAAAKAVQRERDDAIRADALDQREAEIKAPAPAVCDSAEAVSDYRREQAVRAKKLLPLSETRVAPNEPTFASLRRTEYRKLGDNVFDIMEGHLLKAVSVAGRRNDSVPFDSPPREIHETGKNGEQTVRFLAASFSI
jgi:hypothetical protein